MNTRIRSRAAIALLSIVTIVWTVAPAVADDGIATLRETSKAFTEVAKNAIPAVVSVRVEKTITEQGSTYFYSPFDDEFFERFFGPRYRPRVEPRKRQQVGQGSGFIISEDGYILTNNHVVGEADKIVVTLRDGKEHQAKLVGTDPGSDVALIKIDAEKLPTIELGDSDALEIGEWVIAVGSPFGLQATVTVGVVSAKSRGVGITQYEDFIQTDAAINPGNSGGPLLNVDGKAVGINTAIFSQSGGYMGIGFAIPVNMAKSILNQLKETGKVTRGYLGIIMHPEKISSDLAEAFGLKSTNGVLITEVVPDSPAEKAGLERRDVIIKMNDQNVEDWQSFRNAIAMLKPGTRIDLTVVRDGKQKKATVEIGALDESELAMGGASSRVNKLGVQVQELTEELAQRFGYGRAKGVIVTEVAQDSPADRAGITPGILIMSVNRRDVTTVEEFNKAVEEFGKTGKLVLLVRNERFAQYVVVNLD
ncbi:MAG TPA: DegQ family serine endoprotease [Anaerohalosphaeraceae bacterium]|jgi:serine protease Do|nr:DegQ family serine endoprotease [Anaerohalosphaeraceae bacterium]HRT51195.1 DegQ family serine endoprotease [Anaerohalosphaeraceae bacterium]HRT87457.1 DegQ family serine endoprotease [Anaerohalosphaeraceae bacterium]